MDASDKSKSTKSSKIFNLLIDEKIDIFRRSFTAISRNIFINANGELIHPGEFGKYREECCKNLIRAFIPKNLDISQGFIISSADTVSTECDIIIYCDEISPLIENSEQQKFFFSETTSAVGEVKSIIQTEGQLKKILLKLAKIKSINKPINNNYINRDHGYLLNPTETSTDKIFTFLICEKLSFYNSKKLKNLNNIYGEFNAINRHNLILSIEDGLFAYYTEDEGNKKTSYEHPVIGKKPLLSCQINADSNNSHIKGFLHFLFKSSSEIALSKPVIQSYLGFNSYDSIFAISSAKNTE